MRNSKDSSKQRDGRVRELKVQAKRLGIRGFSRMRKRELLTAIDSKRNSSNILDEDVPITQSPILKPSAYLPPAKDEIKDEIKDLEVMLGLRSPPKIKITSPEETERDRRIREIKELNKRRPRITTSRTASALRGFARQYRITADVVAGAREFLQTVRLEVNRLLRENPGTRVILILNSQMERLNLIEGDRLSLSI
jgi:hypothetical protein